MDDRELLEMAARAAGIEVPKKVNPWVTYSKGRGFEWLSMDGSAVEDRFDPLNDDGDALRLAVSLNMTLGVGIARTDQGEASEFSGDPYAATRRAIVRAAAAVGEGMV